MSESKDKTSVTETHFHDQVQGPVHTGSGNINITVQTINPFSLAAPLERLSSFFNWAEAEFDIQASSYDLYIWSLRQLIEKLTSDHLIKLCAIFLIWIGANFLLVPAFQWPLNDPLQRRNILVNLAIGCVLLPVIIGLLTPAKDTLHFCLKSRKQKLVLFFFRLTGAVVGFVAFVLVLIFLAMVLYYLDVSLSRWGWYGLVLLGPLAFSHISARLIPSNQLKQHGPQPHWRQIEGWWLVIYLATGPGIALLLNEYYDALIRSEIGFSLLVLLLCMALWAKQQSDRPFLSKRLALFFFGVYLPILFVLLGVLLLEPELGWQLLTPEAFYTMLLILIYLFSPFTYWVALMLGNYQLKLSIPGTFLFLLTILAAYGLPYLPQFVALLAVVIGIAIWVPLGRYFFGLHPSFGFILLTIIGSLVLWSQTAVPLPLNSLFTLGLIGLFIWWTYRDGYDKNSDQLSETH
jgi:hypothetical protein